MPTVGDNKAIIADVASHAGIPAWLMLDIAEGESSFNDRALGDNGQSYGLFQLYTNGGLGNGYTKDQLYDPRTNAQIAARAMAPKYLAGRAQGIDGEALLLYVANSAGWPGNGGTAWVDRVEPQYNVHLRAIYQKNKNDSYHTGSGPTTGGTVDLSKDGILGQLQGMDNKQVTQYAAIGVGVVALIALLS